MSDIVKRLRSEQNPGLAVRQQAADALERLTAENAALRKAVKGFLDDYASDDGMYNMKHYVREFHAAMGEKS